MKNLKDILYKVGIQSVVGTTDLPISSIAFDSRDVKSDSLFVAQKGLVFDGHVFIEKAIEKGAKAIICEVLPIEFIPNITYVKVDDSNIALAIVASNFYDNPSSKLKLIGVTGTNGKTTIATLLYRLFKKLNYKSGLLSTIKIMIDDVEVKTTHTTPDSLKLNIVF